MRSIRRELLLWLLLGLVVAVVAAATSTYYQARHEARELFDYQLKQLALSVSNQRVSLVPEAQSHNHDEDFVIQIWDRDQKLFYSSQPGVEIPIQPVPGFAYVKTEQGRWRVYGLRDRDKPIRTADGAEKGLYRGCCPGVAHPAHRRSAPAGVGTMGEDCGRARSRLRRLAARSLACHSPRRPTPDPGSPGARSKSTRIAAGRFERDRSARGRRADGTGDGQASRCRHQQCGPKCHPGRR